MTLEVLKEQKITVVIDETGDRKKGTKTDYVARQYLGSVGKIDRGIVSVNAYGVYKNITFPPQWNHQTGWKNILNNFRLIIQPTLLFWLIFPWLEIFPNSFLLLGFHRLINIMNQIQSFPLSG